jgi:hypothetical protein
MKSFTDNEKRKWIINVNVTTVMKVRALIDFDILDVADQDNGVFIRLAEDPVLLVNVLYALCQEQAIAADVSDEDFGRAMAGNVIARATEVLLDEIVNFTPNQRDRERLRRVLRKLKAVETMAHDRLDAMIEGDELEKTAEAMLKKQEERFTCSLESPE